MKLEVHLVNESGMDCVEIEYATVAKYLGRNYELMFIDAWGFEVAEQMKVRLARFSEEEKKELMKRYKDTIGNRLSVGDIEIEKYLQQYHGIKVNKSTTKELTHVIHIIKEQIDKGMPVAMWFDQHYMPWTKEIRKEGPLRYAGRMMIHGYDDEKKLFYCLDIHGRMEGQVMPFAVFEEFLNAQEEFTYDTFELTEKRTVPTIEEFFAHVIAKIQGEQVGHPNMFQHMQWFADYVESSLNMENEIAVSQGRRTMPNTPTHIMFIRNFVRIARMRNMFALAIEYMGKIHEDKRLFEISNQFRLFSANWHQIVAILTKAFFRSSYDGLGNKLKDFILDFSMQEQEMLKHLREFIIQDTSVTRGIPNMVANINASEKLIQLSELEKEYEHTVVELKTYFNNTAFAVDRAHTQDGDFDGIGDCFVLEEQVPLHDLEGGGIPFEVFLGTGKPDNMICQGQQIQLEHDATYDYLNLAGACDSGPFFGRVEVTYEDGMKENIVYGFGEWRFKMCEFKESVLYECDRFYNGNIHPEERGYMFYKTLPLCSEKKIVSIQFPQCMNMHIFAMTFSRQKNV